MTDYVKLHADINVGDIVWKLGHFEDSEPTKHRVIRKAESGRIAATGFTQAYTNDRYFKTLREALEIQYRRVWDRQLSAEAEVKRMDALRLKIYEKLEDETANDGVKTDYAELLEGLSPTLPPEVKV